MHTMPMLSLALCSGHANVVIGLVQRSGNQCHDRPCAVIGQVPVQLETISPMVATKKKKTTIYINVYIFHNTHLLFVVVSCAQEAPFPARGSSSDLGMS